MKKFLVLLLFLITGSVLAEELPDKYYTIIKTTHNYSPIRESANVNSKRFSHLKKGATIFSDESTKDFYRVDLGLDKYYWIEKRYVDEEIKVPEKNLQKIDQITLTDDKKYYTVKIKTPVLTAYNEIETSSNSLDFIIYDTIVDKENLTIKGDNPGGFEISKDKFDNLKISYSSNLPLSGHEVSANENELILKVRKPFDVSSNRPLKNLTIVIDPGHGGKDTGACAFNLKEKDINMQISKHLEEVFKKEGAKVYLTREEDTNPDLYDRIDFAKEKGADFLISIHQNSLANRERVNEKHGVGVYYYNKETYKLAEEIQKSLVEKTGFRDDGVNLASFALTRAPNPLCVLVECGYIIHPEESKKLNTPEFQKIVAKGIADGTKNYLKNNFKLPLFAKRKH